MKTQNYKNIENASLKKQNKNATMKRGDNKWLTERRPNANCTWILQRLKITKIQKKFNEKMPSEMEVAPRFTLLAQFILLHCFILLKK